ncbi:hypothetical protein CCP3SC15_210007 [Gammaproteobacteria bacterium]
MKYVAITETYGFQGKHWRRGDETGEITNAQDLKTLNKADKVFAALSNGKTKEMVLKATAPVTQKSRVVELNKPKAQGVDPAIAPSAGNPEDDELKKNAAGKGSQENEGK